LEIDLKTNNVICGDNIEWLKEIPSNSISMCYIDPPFFTNKNYEIIWGNGYERRSFDDRWKGTVKTYIVWMEERVREIHRVLKPTGSIFLHCDWRASHRLRCMLDDVFGENNFLNEVIWSYKRWTGKSKKFQRLHNNIFLYSKTENYKFNVLKTDYTAGSKERKMQGILNRFKDGKSYRVSNKSLNKEGVSMGDVWADIPFLPPSCKERKNLGYRTQKPEDLVKRIIECSTNKGDTVLDCFGGGGTTASAAAQLGRKFIIGDVSPVAIRVMSKRLNDLKMPPQFDVLNVPRTKEDWLLMNGHEFADKICSFMGWECNPKKSNDGGVDGWADNHTIPIQIKSHRNRIGRPDIQKFVGALNSFEKGLFVAWDFTPTAWDYIVEAEKEMGKIVEFIKVEDILGDILIDSDKKMEIEKLLLDRVSL